MRFLMAGVSVAATLAAVPGLGFWIQRGEIAIPHAFSWVGVLTITVVAAITYNYDRSESILYWERYQPERSEWDNSRADTIRAVCLKSDRPRCDILTLHPDQWRNDTPWFPAPPEGVLVTGRDYV